MGYFDLKKQLSTKQTSTSKTGYFALKQKVSPVIQSNVKRQQEEQKKKQYEEAVKNAEIAKQASQKAGSTWGLAKETAKGVGKTLLDFGKEAIRFPITAPLKVVQSLTEGFTGKPQVYTPETKVEKFLYGAEPRQSYQQDQAGVSKWTQEKGLGKGASTAIGAGVASAEVLADLALPGMASKIFKSAIGKSILSKMGVKSTKIVEAVSKGTTTEKEIVEIFEEKGLKGVEEVVAEPTVLKPGELAPVVKEIETKTGKKFKPSEALQVKADLEKGISKEAIINDIVEPPKRTTKPVEPPKQEKGVKTPESPLIQEARKYKSAEEFVRAQGTPEILSEQFDGIKNITSKSNDVQEIFTHGSYGNKPNPRDIDIAIKLKGGINDSTKLIDEIKDFTRQYAPIKGKEGGFQNAMDITFIDNKGKAFTWDGIEIRPSKFVPIKTKSQLTDIWNKSQPLQEGVKVEVPKVELTPSKVAKSVEAKAVEEKLTKGFGDIAGYEKITIKEQAQKTAKLLDEEFDNAVKMVKGEIPVKEGIKPEMLIKTMEDYAQAKGDVNLLRDIAKSPLVSETSAHAQALRILAERNPESALVNIQKVAKERATALEKKTGKTIDKVTKETVDEIKSKVKQKTPTKQDWDNFINEIKC